MKKILNAIEEDKDVFIRNKINKLEKENLYEMITCENDVISIITLPLLTLFIGDYFLNFQSFFTFFSWTILSVSVIPLFLFSPHIIYFLKLKINKKKFNNDFFTSIVSDRVLNLFKIELSPEHYKFLKYSSIDNRITYYQLVHFLKEIENINEVIANTNTENFSLNIDNIKDLKILITNK